tara:strand:+ start:196 stop:627 length:432 start_codon:yes stop_codon:yes gene_type:complete
MNAQDSKQLVLTLHNIWNSGNVDEIPHVYATDCIVHWAKGWGPESRGHSQIKDAILNTRRVFPDWHEEVLDIVVTPDKVVTRYCSTGTQQRKYLGISPTGRKVAFEEISIYRIHQYRVVEQWCLGDDLHCIEQLSSVGEPPPG